MNAVSLFDGIGCGRVALKRIGLPVDCYYASEIDDAAMAIAKHNHADIVEIGDVSKVRFANGILYTERGEFSIGHVDLLIGGSPCTDFSSIGYATGMTSGQVEITSLAQYLSLKSAGVQFDGQSYLFWEYVRILQELQPDYYLLENVVMAKKWQKIITNALGVQPLLINSSLMSAQNRPRLYWTNIPNVEFPVDTHIALRSILSSTCDTSDVSYCKTVQRSLPKFVAKYGYVPEMFNPYNVKEITDKACALSRGSMITSSCATLVFVPQSNGVHEVRKGLLNDTYPVLLSDGRYNIRRLGVLEMERLQTLPDGYTDGCGISLTKRGATIGNGWTVNVVAHILSYIPV